MSTYDNKTGVRVLRPVKDDCPAEPKYDIDLHHIFAKPPTYPTSVHAVQGPPGCQGPAGMDGRDGQPGVEGKEGVKGDRGEMGLRGEDGRDGKDGRDGQDGQTGPIGPQGMQGVPGKDSLLDFDVCVEDGVAYGLFTFNTGCGPKTVKLCLIEEPKVCCPPESTDD